MTIVAYTFKADIYCPDCIVAQVKPDGQPPVASTEDALGAIAAARGIDHMDEWSFDSDDFPKVVFSDQTDGTEFCAQCHKEI